VPGAGRGSCVSSSRACTRRSGRTLRRSSRAGGSTADPLQAWRHRRRRRLRRPVGGPRGSSARRHRPQTARLTTVTVGTGMADPALTVVTPVRNEARDLPKTIAALLTAVDASDFDAEVVLVDDGSTDDSVSVAREAIDGRVPLHVLSQPNRGRFEARRIGVHAARGEFVLLLDGRVRVHSDALAYVSDRIAQGRDVWTAHVDVEDDGNPYGAFWKLIAELAWSDYFDDPRDSSFGVEDFDRFPKGTTCFFARRELVLEAIAAFRSKYSDVRRANDDTPLLR